MEGFKLVPHFRYEKFDSVNHAVPKHHYGGTKSPILSCKYSNMIETRLLKRLNSF